MEIVQKNNINIFLKRLAKIYKRMGKFATDDTVYYELMRTFYNNGKIKKIDESSNEAIIKIIKKKFSFTEFDLFDIDYFFILNNYVDTEEDEFYDFIDKSFKLYVEVDKDNLLDVSTKIYNYILDKKMMVQSKIADNMRCDVFVIRVAKYEDAKDLINYINSIDYHSKISPNPFSLKCGKVSVTKDGKTSYNAVVSTIIDKYLKSRLNTKSIGNVSFEDFCFFVNNEVYNKNSYELARDNYNNINKGNNIVISEEEDFYILCYDILRKNLDGTLDFNSFRNYKIAQSLPAFNAVDKREDNVINNEELINICKDILIRNIKATYKKYGEYQAHQAMIMLLDDKNYNGFTNDNDLRKELRNITTYENLKQIIIDILENESLSLEEFINNCINKSYKR